MSATATATSCSCGSAVLLTEIHLWGRQHRWQAHCDGCLDLAEDAGPLAHVVGYGQTPFDALWAWQDAHDSAWADRIEWSVVTMGRDVFAQAAAEFARQAGWFRRVYGSKDDRTVVWGPNSFESASPDGMAEKGMHP